MKNGTKRKLKTTTKGIILAVYLIFIVFPFVWMLLTSFKGSQGEIYAFPVTYLPKAPSLKNYIAILVKGSFGKYMLNSFVVAASAAAIAEVIGIMAAYVLSRFKFRGKKCVTIFFLITQMIPAFVMLGPLRQIISGLGLLDDLRGLILLYTNMTIPFTVVTLIGFYDNVPKSLEEAAWIDGCGYLKGLWHIVIPTIKPGIMATFIFAFVNSWNELYLAIMFINSDANKTIPVGLNSLILSFDIKWGEMAAGSVLALIPTILLFSIAQKYMVEGLTAGAVKE